MTEISTSNGGGSEKFSGKHLCLIDGSAYVFRAYHALPPLTRKKDGLPVGAVSGFCSMLYKLIQDFRSDSDFDFFAVVLDAGRKTFRNEIYSQYKANRPPAPEDLVPQFPLISAASRAFGLPTIELAGFEADDIIASYASVAAKADMTVTVVSSDKDLMQLVGDRIEMFDPMKQRTIGPNEVFAKFGVAPDRVIDVQALCGDTIDNVPGVPGIGIKTAAQLITEYGDLDGLLENSSKIKQPKRRDNLIEFSDLARLSRQLVTLKRDVPLETGLEGLRFAEYDQKTLFPFLEDMEFFTLLKRVRTDLSEVYEIKDGATNDKLNKRNYVCIQDISLLNDWVSLATNKGLVAVDTETTSLDAMRAKLVGVSLSLEPGKACYIPLAHQKPVSQNELDLGDAPAEADAEVLKQIPFAEALAALKPLLENPCVLKVGQNIKYDMQVFARYGLGLHPFDDTMLLSYVTDGGVHGHGLDELSKIHLDVTPVAFKEVAGTGKSSVTFDFVSLGEATNYAAEDADLTLQIYNILKPRLPKYRVTRIYESLERPLVPVLVSMENAGVLVDRSELQRLSENFSGRMTELQKKIFDLADGEFNVNSSKQLGEMLFEKMSLPGGKRTKTGLYATGAGVLEELAFQGHALPTAVLEYRRLAKLKSTYTDAIQLQINPETGRVHTSYSMAATSTGRLASTDPNLQNIPIRTEDGRKIRRAFIAPKGKKLISVDYSQIELRILAHMANIEALRVAFRDGVDIHALTASEVFNTPIHQIDQTVRRSAKAINFGIIYGISAFGLANNLGISRSEAQYYIESYFQRYPGIKDYTERIKSICRELGFVETIFGRRIFIPGINETNSMRRGFYERAAVNAPIQGSAADIIKRAMIEIPKSLRSAGVDARMLLQVHDELIFEAVDNDVVRTIEIVTGIMEASAELTVPLTVDSGVGYNWAEAH